MSAWQRSPARRDHGRGAPRHRGAPEPVPPRALALSAAALALPLAAQWFAPGLANEEIGILVWLPALVPAFLLTYYRGWRGASVAIAVGMAALALTQAAIAARRSVAPDWPVILGLIVVLMSVSLGIGWVGELLHRAHHEAEELALVDPVTGIPNRRHLAPYLDAACAAAERGTALTVVIFDVDGFRQLERADPRHAEAALRMVARIVTEHTRRLDLTARIGGDELVTVLTGATPEDARRLIDQVRAALAAESFPGGPVTVSAGVAAHGRGVASPDVLLAEADRALHRAREAGADQVVVWRSGAQGGGAQLAAGALEGFAADDDAGDGAGAGARAGAGHRRVLMVDGEGDAEAASALIGRLGFEVEQAADAYELMERLRGRAADVVVSDLHMPGMSGFTLADRIAAEHPGVPVLLTSRYDHDALSGDRRPAAVVGILRKPLELRELGVALEQALAGARTSRRARTPA